MKRSEESGTKTLSGVFFSLKVTTTHRKSENGYEGGGEGPERGLGGEAREGSRGREAGRAWSHGSA